MQYWSALKRQKCRKLGQHLNDWFSGQDRSLYSYLYGISGMNTGTFLSVFIHMRLGLCILEISTTMLLTSYM